MEKKNGKGKEKYLFIGGEIEWRRQKREVFGEGKYFVSGGEAEWKIFVDGFCEWVFQGIPLPGSKIRGGSMVNL